MRHAKRGGWLMFSILGLEKQSKHHDPMDDRPFLLWELQNLRYRNHITWLSRIRKCHQIPTNFPISGCWKKQNLFAKSHGILQWILQHSLGDDPQSSGIIPEVAVWMSSHPSYPLGNYVHIKWYVYDIYIYMFMLHIHIYIYTVYIYIYILPEATTISAVIQQSLSVVRHLFDLRQYRCQVFGDGAFLHHVPELSGARLREVWLGVSCTRWWYPPVIQHSYGRPPFFMGKSTVNGNVQ